MKRHNILNKILKHIMLPPLRGGLGVGLLLPLFLLSCNDIVTYGDDDYIAPEDRPNEGRPEILGVYEVRDVIYDTKLDSVTPGQRIRIHGKNLNHAQSISFNGFAADMSQVASAPDYCIAYVPSDFVIGQNSGLVYTTDQGSTTYKLAISTQPLEVQGLYCEFAEPGTTATVVGRWFKSYGFGSGEQATVKLGDKQLEVSNVSNDGLDIAIPADAQPGSIVTFTWLDANAAEHQYQCYYRPSAYRIFDDLNLSLGDSFNDQAGYDLTAYVEADGIDGIQSLGSPILHIEGKAKQWGWYSANIDSELHTPYNIAGTNDYDASLTQGYNLVFEVMTLSPVPSSADNDVNGITFSLEWGDRCEWCPSTAEAEFDTKGQWQTVSLPLSEVAKKGLRPSSWGGTTHVGIIISPIVDNAVYNLRLSNFRIVKDLNI